MPASQAMIAMLADEARRLAELMAARRTSAPGQSVKPPTEQQVRGFLSNLVGTMEADPEAGRTALADSMSTVVCTPSQAPRYRCRAELRLPGGLGPGAVGHEAREELTKLRSGGRRRYPSHLD